MKRLIAWWKRMVPPARFYYFMAYTGQLTNGWSNGNIEIIAAYRLSQWKHVNEFADAVLNAPSVRNLGVTTVVIQDYKLMRVERDFFGHTLTWVP